MKNKLFLFEFDETLSTWDSSQYLYSPRPYMYLLISFLVNFSTVCIYSREGDSYLCDLFVEKNLLHYDKLKVITKKPNDLSQWDYIEVHSVYCKECTTNRNMNSRSIYIVPHHLASFGSKDIELLLFKNYLQRKLDFDMSFEDHDFSDWSYRLAIDYKFYNKCSNICK